MNMQGPAMRNTILPPTQNGRLHHPKSIRRVPSLLGKCCGIADLNQNILTSRQAETASKSFYGGLLFQYTYNQRLSSGGGPTCR